MNTLAYSTNSLTTTSDDLSGIASGRGVIRRPVTLKHQPRTKDGLRHPVTVRLVGVQHEGTSKA